MNVEVLCKKMNHTHLKRPTLHNICKNMYTREKKEANYAYT